MPGLTPEPRRSPGRWKEVIEYLHKERDLTNIWPLCGAESCPRTLQGVCSHVPPGPDSLWSPLLVTLLLGSQASAPFYKCYSKEAGSALAWERAVAEPGLEPRSLAGSGSFSAEPRCRGAWLLHYEVRREGTLGLCSAVSLRPALCLAPGTGMSPLTLAHSVPPTLGLRGLFPPSLAWTALGSGSAGPGRLLRNPREELST